MCLVRSYCDVSRCVVRCGNGVYCWGSYGNLRPLCADLRFCERAANITLIVYALPGDATWQVRMEGAPRWRGNSIIDIVVSILVKVVLVGDLGFAIQYHW
jgi:hypothetical protein